MHGSLGRDTEMTIWRWVGMELPAVGTAGIWRDIGRPGCVCRPIRDSSTWSHGGLHCTVIGKWDKVRIKLKPSEAKLSNFFT